MNTKRKKRLQITLLIVMVLMVATGLVLYALRQNINLFYTPTQLVEGKAPPEALIRLGGMVVKGSVKHDANSLLVTFILTDFTKKITVSYNGVLPTLFKEGQGIVAQGHYGTEGRFVANEVLAKHDENYMPKALKDALAKKNKVIS